MSKVDKETRAELRRLASVPGHDRMGMLAKNHIVDLLDELESLEFVSSRPSDEPFYNGSHRAKVSQPNIANKPRDADGREVSGGVALRVEKVKTPKATLTSQDDKREEDVDE